MNNKLSIIFVYCILCATLQAQTGWLLLDDKTIPLDKQTHIVAGGAAGSVGYTLGYSWSKGNRSTATWTGIGFATVLGTIKELNDINTTGFDRDDLFSTIIGGVASTFITDLIMSKYTWEDRKKLRQQRELRVLKAREEHELERLERKLKQ